MPKLLFLTLLIVTCPVIAEPATQEPVNQGNTEPSAANPEEKQADATQQTEAAPQADNLRNRDLGDAFRNFQPSEEISADNAVTFPVDI